MESLEDKIKKEVISWSNRFPIDRWWRKKYNIPYMSKAHKECSFLDQYFDFIEEKEVKKYIESFGYIPNISKWINEQCKSEKQREESLIDEARREMSELPDFND